MKDKQYLVIKELPFDKPESYASFPSAHVSKKYLRRGGIINLYV